VSAPIYEGKETFGHLNSEGRIWGLKRGIQQPMRKRTPTHETRELGIDPADGSASQSKPP